MKHAGNSTFGCSGGLHVGAAVGVFVGTRELLAVYRNVKDAPNTVAAATLTGALYGMLGTTTGPLFMHSLALITVKGPLPTRLRSAGIMAALGGVSGYPIALLHDAVAQWDGKQPGGELASDHVSAESIPRVEQRDMVDTMVAAMLASVDDENNAPKKKNAPPQSWWPWSKRID